MAAIRQQERVKDNIQEFEMLVSQAPQTTEKQLLGYCLAGLHTSIRNQVRTHDPKDLIRAMEIPRDVEDAVQESRPANGFAFQTNPSSFQYQGGGVVV